MPVPVVGGAHRVIALVAELEAPHAFELDGCDEELGLGVLALQRLDQGDAVEDEGAGQVDRVDAAALARAVDAGRAGTERVGHALKSKRYPPPGRARYASGADLRASGDEDGTC